MDFLKGIVGGQPAQAPIQGEDADFADFAGAPAPSPMSIPASMADTQPARPTEPSWLAMFGPPGQSGGPVVYTKWYRVWERTSPKDFQLEMVLIPLILVAVLIHYWGTGVNKRKARKWMAVHQPVLDSEFALVGFHKTPKITPYPEGVQTGQRLFEASAKLSGEKVADDMLREKTAWEYEAYASGRANVAFVDMRIYLKRRMNPTILFTEEIMGLFFDSVKPKPEHMEAVIYAFDGKEKDFVPPSVPGTEEIEKPKSIGNSSYDPFVFAVVNKMEMRKLRDERYDVSLTFTKDNPKLPDWVTVMSESAEITDALLTKDLIDAINAAGDNFQYLIVSDQPMDKPNTLDEAKEKKRLHLSMRLPSGSNYLPTLPLFAAFLRLPDQLASTKFRPEVMRKITATREAEKAKLKKISDQQAEEDRLRAVDKMKKEERDRKMKGMTAEEQRKFLEKESEKARRKEQKKMTRRG